MWFVMAVRKRILKFRWRHPATPEKQVILKRAKRINTLNNRGCMPQALKAEHEAIETALLSLEAAVLSSASRAEIIDVMNALVAFCAVHFADEEAFMRRSCHSRLGAHAAAHKRLLAKFVAARRGASGEGISLATLDHLDLLLAFRRHVAVWDRQMTAELSITANRVLTAAHG
jgi:hemerythrin-like metal-binding protein